MKAVLKYPGAKNRIAPGILSYIPEHQVYLESFGGSLAVLFNKKRSHIETVNDMDEEIVNFFQVIREHPKEFSDMIRFTPYARSEYKKAYEACDDKMEKARRFAVKCWMGFGCGNLYQNGFKSGQQTNSPNPAKEWEEFPETIIKAADRLKGVQIECLPAVELIQRYDTSDVFIYADPPYLPSLRKNYLYKCEMSELDHRELLDVLKKHPGKVLISGYENELYNQLLDGWTKAYKKTNAEHGLQREEVLWMNYKPEYEQLTFGLERG